MVVNTFRAPAIRWAMYAASWLLSSLLSSSLLSFSLRAFANSFFLVLIILKLSEVETSP